MGNSPELETQNYLANRSGDSCRLSTLLHQSISTLLTRETPRAAFKHLRATRTHKAVCPVRFLCALSRLHRDLLPCTSCAKLRQISTPSACARRVRSSVHFRACLVQRHTSVHCGAALSVPAQRSLALYVPLRSHTVCAAQCQFALYALPALVVLFAFCSPQMLSSRSRADSNNASKRSVKRLTASSPIRICSHTRTCPHPT